MDKLLGRHLRGLDGFQLLSEEVIEQLAQEARAAEYSDGDRIWNTGDEAAYFTFISRGLVQIVKANARGEDCSLGIFGTGEGIGNLAALQGTHYPAAAVVISERCTIRRIPASAVIAMMNRVPDLQLSINRTLMAKTRALVTKIDMLSAGPVSARLALLFQHLLERFGDEGQGGGKFIPISLTRGTIARLVGAREETVIRVLSDWRQRGWMSTTEHGFEVQRPEMLEAAITSVAP